MTTKIKHLERRIERLENVLIELVLHKNRCKYIYLTDLKQAMINRKLIKEKTRFVKIEKIVRLVKNEDRIK